MELPAFFDSMLPFLMGEKPAAAFERELGDSPSGTARLALYRTLIWRERVSILRLLYPGTRRLAERLRPGEWERLERAHIERYRSNHFEPNRVGESFPSLVEELCTEPVVRVLAETADYEWLVFSVETGQHAEVQFRAYEHDVAGLLDAAARAAREIIVRQKPTVVALHRTENNQLRTTHLGAVELAALARRRNLSSPSRDVAKADVEVADEWLTRRGVLPERPV